MILKVLLTFMWTRGRSSTLRRLDEDTIDAATPSLRPGDVLLIGNGGAFSHCAVYAGDGAIVHSMATERTMRGTLGSLLDVIALPFRLLSGRETLTGVLHEPLHSFVQRFHRDCLVALRDESLDDAQVQRGLGHIQALVGKAYDYDFTWDDAEFYCTEIVIEYLRHARADTADDVLPRRRVRIPFLIDTQVLEPVALLDHPCLKPAYLCNGAQIVAPHLIESTLSHK